MDSFSKRLQQKAYSTMTDIFTELSLIEEEEKQLRTLISQLCQRIKGCNDVKTGHSLSTVFYLANNILFFFFLFLIQDFVTNDRTFFFLQLQSKIWMTLKIKKLICFLRSMNLEPSLLSWIGKSSFEILKKNFNSWLHRSTNLTSCPCFHPPLHQIRPSSNSLAHTHFILWTVHHSFPENQSQCADWKRQVRQQQRVGNRSR